MFYFPNNSQGCQRFEGEYLDREGDPDNDFSPIVLVERGLCSFVKKAKNVQELGGALTLIVDNRDGENPENVIMIDDGTGINIAIPTILISKDDGNVLKEAIQRLAQKPKEKVFLVAIVTFEMVRETPSYRTNLMIASSTTFGTLQGILRPWSSSHA